MDGTTFFSKQDFEFLKSKYNNKEIIPLLSFQRQYKTHGNRYEIMIYTRYNAWGTYGAVGDVFYNYACKELFGGRSIGGGNYVTVYLDGDYEDFINEINSVLQFYPDYKADKKPKKESQHGTQWNDVHWYKATQLTIGE